MTLNKFTQNKNNIYMNQILVNKNSNKKIKYIFKVQFLISIIIATIFILIFMFNYDNEEHLEEISSEINKAIKLSAMYTVEENKSDVYFGKIIIDKINLEYTVFNEFNEELLKIAPCKFYGKGINDRGNIAIAAHNYNDERFFGRLSELEIKDKIKILSLDNKEYMYTVYDIFETEEDDTSVLKNNKYYELTLITCNNISKKRLVVKSYRT